MLITPILSTKKDNKFINSKTNSSVSFERLLPSKTKLRIAFFDIDETLINWDKNMPPAQSKNIRSRMFNHLKSKKVATVYSSDRSFDNITSLIKDGTLPKPDWIVANNGGDIYKNIKGKFTQVKSWIQGQESNFNKSKIRDIVTEFEGEEGLYGPKEFHKLKATEYVGHPSKTSVRFAVAPEFFQNHGEAIVNKMKNSGIKAVATLFHYPKEAVNYLGLQKYFTPEIALDVEKHYAPKLYPDGTGDSLLISATDKGMAAEFIRKKLKAKPNEVFAIGDGENDISHSNKGYNFVLMSNAIEGLKKAINKTNKKGIISATKPGAEAGVEVLVKRQKVN